VLSLLQLQNKRIFIGHVELNNICYLLTSMLLMTAVNILQKVLTSDRFLIVKNKPETEYNYLHHCVNAFCQHFIASLIIQTTVQSITTRITNF